MKLEFESERFKLVIEGTQKSRTYERTSDHYYTSEVTEVWWAGQGIVVRRKTGAKAPFTFHVDVRGGWNRSKFEEDLDFVLNLAGLSKLDGDASIVDKPRYRDLCLEAWWKKISVANKAAGTIIPEIRNGYGATLTVPEYAEIDFVKLGIQLDDDGQRHLPGVE